jgi:hypothetical protein
LVCPKAFERVESLKVGGKLNSKTDHLAVTLSINKLTEAEKLEGRTNDNEMVSSSTASYI